VIKNWHINPEHSGEVQEWLDRFWPSVLEAPETLIKEDRTARVFICSGMVLKEYRCPRGIKGWIAGWVRSRARRSFRMGAALKAAGIRVPDMLASAIIRTAGSVHLEYLLTREVTNAEPLATWVRNPELTEAALNPVLEQLGALLGDFHRAGFSNRDLKGGNVLVTDPGGNPSLCVVDLDGIRPMPTTAARRICRDFWPVLHSLALYGWDTEDARARLVASYNAHGPRKLDVALLPRTTHTPEVTMPGWIRTERMIRRSGLVSRVLRATFPAEAPEWENRALRYWQRELVHLKPVPASPEAQVEVGQVDRSDCRYYFKRFLMRSRADVFKHLVRCSRAKRTWKGNALAAERGLGVPPTVCLIEIRERGLTIGSVIVTEEVQHTTPLRDLLSGDRGGEVVDAATRRMLATQLGEEVGRWHTAGVVHGDMRHGNILCREEAGQFSFVFVDNERTRLTSSLHERARNLVQLNMMSLELVPLRDRVRLWRAYVRTAPGDPQYKRRLRAEVVEWTQRRWRKQGWL
jgi:tRNA A-37 threonylcarbamoyl transferase component Bud32